MQPAGIADKLTARRKELDLTMEDLASRSGVSFGTVRRIEAGGDLKVSTLRKLSVALNIDTADLLQLA